jgi:hypothetical protein
MYGYSGYATNTYGSSRLSILGPIVNLLMRTLLLGINSFIQPFYVAQGAYGYQLPFTLEDGGGDPVDLTNAVLTLTVQDSQDPTLTALFTGGMSVDGGAGGTCHYTVAEGNFPNPGTFLAQITATWGSSEMLTWPGIAIIVEPALPKTNN